MTNEEIRESVEDLKNFNIVGEHAHSLQICVDFATQVLSVGGMKEKPLVNRYDDPLRGEWQGDNIEINRIESYNQALHDFRIWLANRLMGLEEVIEEGMAYDPNATQYIEFISKAIKELLK